MYSRFRLFIVIPAVMILLGLLLFFGTAGASPSPEQTLKTTPVSDRPGPVPTVYRSTFAPAAQNCWESGCHGEDAPDNSFILPEAGAPALAGPGALPQFSTAFELGTYIHESMPFSPTGSLSEDQAWELTAYILHLNNKSNPELTLSGTNSAAIPVHQDIELPGTELPGILILSLFLILGAVYISQLSRQPAPETKRGNFYHHLHPATIPEAQSKFSYTLGAGGLAIFFSLILLITGALEMYYYLPTPEGAAESIQILTGVIPFGNLIRNLHYWSAQLLVITMMVHLVRIILTGAYAPPRRFNYLLGLILLVLILLLDFTGYVLRWDEGIRWALVVGTNLLKTIPGIGEGLYRFVIGGSEPGAPTLIRFYAWHIFGLTLAVAGITAWHIFRVRRDGGVSAPPPERGKKTNRIPRSKLLRKEIIAMIIAGVVVLLLSVLIPAPIDQPLVENGALVGDSGAPWFFLWIQETLQWGDPFLWGVALPLAAVILLGLLPYILPNAKKEEWGSWLPSGNRLGQIVGITIIAIIFLLTLLGWLR